MKKFKLSLLTPFALSAIIALAIAWGLRPEASGLGPWYERYAEWIRGGFASGDAGEAQTFPMWGYGWLLALAPWPAVLLVGQILITLGGTAFLLRALIDTGRITRAQAVIGAWMLAAYLPWYAGMTAAYSAPAFALGFLLVAFALLIFWLGKVCVGVGGVLAAALSFGVALNFRSDYFAFTPIVAVLLFFGAFDWRRGLAAAGIWLGGVLLAMLPWLIYTHAATGRASLTSTNSGHVLFLSWGDLPANPWGIRVNDGDPVMAGELHAHFGRPMSSLGTAGDRFLRERFFAMVMERPELYAQRLARHAMNLVIGGFYPGIWDADFRDRVRVQYPHENLNTILRQHWRELPRLASSRTTLQVVGEIQARLGLLALVGLAGWAGVAALRRPDPVALLLLGSVCYQVLVSLASHYLRPPLNNQLVLLVCLALWWWQQRGGLARITS